MTLGQECINGHGELTTVKEWCHDYDPECACETIDLCKACGYQRFATCANASPEDFGEPHEGDTWSEYTGRAPEHHAYWTFRDNDWHEIPEAGREKR